MKYILFLLITLPTLVWSQQKTCADLGKALCGKEVSLECLNKNLEKIPSHCLQDIMEQAALAHPCTKQIESGKEISKECQSFLGESEKKVKVMKEHCKALNDCQEVFKRVKNTVEAQKEYQACVEHNATKVSSDCQI